MVVVIGALNAMVLLAHTGFSYVEAPAAHYSARDPGEIAFHDSAARIAPIAMRAAESSGAKIESEPAATRDLTLDLSGEGWMKNPRHFVALYASPLLVSTALVLALLALLARERDSIASSIPDVLLHWSYAFAIVLAFAIPTLVEDFWLSIGWGRMLAMGVNRYYHVAGRAVAGLPLDTTVSHMTYGPLWALISWGLEAIAGHFVLWSAVAFKLLLLGVWMATLRLLHELVRDRSPWERCISMIMVGWLPIGVACDRGGVRNCVPRFRLLRRDERGQCDEILFAVGCRSCNGDDIPFAHLGTQA